MDGGGHDYIAWMDGWKCSLVETYISRITHVPPQWNLSISPGYNPYQSHSLRETMTDSTRTERLTDEDLQSLPARRQSPTRGRPAQSFHATTIDVPLQIEVRAQLDALVREAHATGNQKIIDLSHWIYDRFDLIYFNQTDPTT